MSSKARPIELGLGCDREGASMGQMVSDEALNPLGGFRQGGGVGVA